MSARDRILARLRAAPRPAAGEAATAPDVAGYYAARAPLSAEARYAQFRSAIEAAHAEVFETSVERWPALLAKLCRDKGLANLAYAPGAAEAPRLLAEADLPRLIPFGASMEEFKLSLFDEVQAGITWAKGAIAETGTLIAWTGPDQPRSLSLVPPVHFILLEERSILDDFHQVMQTWAALPTNVLLISGPSKTADIQQTLAYGAHGPKELIVLVLRGEDQA